jgi:hypothetical protein
VTKARHDLGPFVRLSNVWESDQEIMAHYCARWQDSGNPYYVWEAMDICSSRKLAFPDWVRCYLDQCAQRMVAAQTRTSKGLKEILPRVLGFPRKRGAWHPLQPEGKASEFMASAVVFATAIEKGMRPTDALSEAYMVLGQRQADKIDAKTLREHIKKLYGVKKAPRSNAEWKALLRAWYLEKFLSGKYLANYRRDVNASSK